MTVVPQKYLANYCVRNFGMQPQLATITYPSPFFRGYNSMPSRRTAGFLIVLALLSTAFGQRRDLDRAKPAASGTVIYSEEGAILVKVPSGWVTNERNGRVLGIQCTFYPAHSSWINAPSIMYPDIATKGPGQTSAQELMEKDLKGLRAIYPKITIAKAEDLPTAEGKKAKVRYIYGLDHGFINATAYVDEPRIIAVLVLNSKTKKAFNDSLPLFREFVASQRYMDVRFDAASSNSNKVRY